MKGALLVLFYSLMSVILYGQDLAVSVDNMNVAYVDKDNPITVIAEGYKCSELIVSCDNGTLTKSKDCHYIFHPQSTGWSEITVCVKTKSGVKEIGTKGMNVRQAVNCRIVLAGKAGGKISVDELKSVTGPDLIFSEAGDERKASIKLYRISFILGDSSVFVEEISGRRFSNRCNEIIEKMKPGDRLIIENIKVGFANGRVSSFNSLTFDVE